MVHVIVLPESIPPLLIDPATRVDPVGIVSVIANALAAPPPLFW